MTRVPQPIGHRGSLKWIQRAIDEQWHSLSDPLLLRLSGATSIEWLSPLKSDDYAEYRDGDFIDLIDQSHLCEALKRFWPAGGPQWDALGRSDRGDVLLVEAKAHVAEICSSPTAASAASKERITAALEALATRLDARPHRAAWTDFFYQLANRLAHLGFLHDHGVRAYLVLVNFLNDAEMNGPTSVETWQAAYEVAFHVMGLPKRHPLSPFILDVYPDVTGSRGSRV